jgi:hypothetical protein
LKNYILRIYQYKKNNPGRFVGVVEEPQRKEKKAFTNFQELWEILDLRQQKETDKNNKSWKLSEESRRHIRKDAVLFTGYSTNSSLEEIISNGVITNISKSGICLLTPEALNKGENVLVKCHTNSVVRRATVRWSKQYKDCHCRAGLEFME